MPKLAVNSYKPLCFSLRGAQQKKKESKRCANWAILESDPNLPEAAGWQILTLWLQNGAEGLLL